MKMYVSSLPSKLIYVYIFDVCLQIIFLLLVSGNSECKGQHCCDFLNFIRRGNVGCISNLIQSVAELKLFKILKLTAKLLGIESICLVCIYN